MNACATRTTSITPGTTHDEPLALVVLDLLDSMANLSSARDALALSNEGSHCLSLPGKQLAAKTASSMTYARDSSLLLAQLRCESRFWSDRFGFHGLGFIIFICKVSGWIRTRKKRRSQTTTR